MRLRPASGRSLLDVRRRRSRNERESPPGKQAAHKPLPQCKAFLICEEAEVDDVTGQFNLYGVVNALAVSSFPADVPPLVIFLQLYDGIGRYELSAELRDLAGGVAVAAEAFTTVDFPERLVRWNWLSR